jgi:hypothetical protein
MREPYERVDRVEVLAIPPAVSSNDLSAVPFMSCCDSSFSPGGFFWCRNPYKRAPSNNSRAPAAANGFGGAPRPQAASPRLAEVVGKATGARAQVRHAEEDTTAGRTGTGTRGCRSCSQSRP